MSFFDFFDGENLIVQKEDVYMIDSMIFIKRSLLKKWGKERIFIKFTDNLINEN